MWRFVHPNKIEYSYINSSQKGYDSRIDKIYCNSLLQSKVKKCFMTQSPAPDHRAVVLDFVLADKERGPGYWKLNNSILSDVEYKQGIQNLYDEIMNEYTGMVSKCLVWEFFKLRVKEFTIAYCVKKANSYRCMVKTLEGQLNDINRTNSKMLSQEQIHKREALQQELDLLYDEKAKGYQIRSRAKWIEEGEKSTRYFLNLEKSRQTSDTIYSLKNNRNTRCTSDSDILNVASSYFKNLYSSKVGCSTRNELELYFQNVNVNILNDEERNSCEGNLTLKECELAVKRMHKSTSPGLDGITLEFYNTFWPTLGKFMVEMYNESFESGILPKSLNTGVIKLIHKKDDKEDISNYRPISLTNVDYRILAFTIANRIQNVISTIVSNDQTAYIKNRFMGTNIRLVQDVIEHFDVTQKSGLLLMLDFTKAFDSLTFEFIIKTLEFFNFGPQFIHLDKDFILQTRSMRKEQRFCV